MPSDSDREDEVPVPTIKIASWNVNGDLAIKMTIPDFTHRVTSFDLVALQETHLTDALTRMLKIPSGFSFLGIPRPFDPLEEDSPQGGVGFLYRSHLPLNHFKELSSQDIMVCSLGSLTVISAYIPPEYSRFRISNPVVAQAEDRLVHLLSILTSPDSPTPPSIILLGDWNARIASFSPSLSIRSSPDLVSNARGNRLLRILRKCEWHVLNGDLVLDRVPRMTSFQPRGTAVVDYIAASQDVYDSMYSFETRELDDSDLSDHALLTAELADHFTATQETVEHQLAYPILSLPTILPRNSLDDLVDTIMDSACSSPRRALRMLYGVCGHCERNL